MEYLKDIRIWLVCGLIILILAMCGVLDVDAKEKQTYWIGANVQVLAFLGKPPFANLTPVKLITYKKQEVTLFHKDSGPGIYAFFLKDLIVIGNDKRRTKVRSDGYFLAKRNQVSEDYWLKKESMKKKTKAPPKPEQETDFDYRHIPEVEEKIIIW